MSKPTKDWIQSLGGKALLPIALTPDMVSLRDIPVALSRRKRFSGQTVETLDADFIGGGCQEVEGYSVAQHCVVGSHLIEPAFALAFLLHEVSEVYLPDVANPLKPHLFVNVSAALEMYPAERLIAHGPFHLAPWRVLEAQHAGAILPAIDLPGLLAVLDSPQVKAMDLQMLAAEKLHLMGPEPMSWKLPAPPHPGATLAKLWPWDEKEARDAWLQRFEELTH